ncbi:MAG: hypothetical protein ABJA82_11855 [Myxococcales bacterium]
MRCFSSRVLVFGLTCLAICPDWEAGMAGAQTLPPAARGAPATPTSGQRVLVEMKFVEPSGATLAERRIELTLGKTETVSIPKGSRTVSAETTITRGPKAGCHHVDVTLRDKTIDETGHFNKTTWQSASDPCGTDPISLGPKEETRLQIGVRAAP